MSEQLWGVFFRDSGEEYLVETTQSEGEAHAVAQELDAESFQGALDDYYDTGVGAEPAWADFDGMHFVEPISEELAAEAAEKLARGHVVRVK